jgi:endogenous inhibitor of DNA gyrase (YacG/DUF329 family)
MSDTTPSPGAALQAMRPRATFVCSVCGESYTARTGAPRGVPTCSSRCRQRAWKAREKAKMADQAAPSEPLQ